MNKGRIFVAQFCDDARQEVGNKLSLMGCYTGEMVLQKFPAVLPKLCAYITAITPKNTPFETLTFRATLNGEPLAEIAVLPEQLQPEAHAPSANPEASRLMTNVVMAFTPLVVTKTCAMKIEVETEEGTFLAGSLFIREVEPKATIQ
jgi:hypothetical protein